MGRQDMNPQSRRAKRRRNELIMKCVIVVLVLAVVVLAAVLIRAVVVPEIVSSRQTKEQAQVQADNPTADEGTLSAGEEETEAVTEQETAAGVNVTDAEALEAASDLEEAASLAVMYDYDEAISYLKASENYTTSQDIQDAIAAYEAEKEACISWAPEDVTHIFFHTIIVDPSKAFDGDVDAEGYNQYMVTMDEFSAIMQTMYERGYVMVSLHDMCTVNEDGSMSAKNILLPSGKTPFVLSPDDVSYYHYMSDDGFAQKLIVDENGEIKNTYIEDDGTVSVGDYDLVPWIDDFVREHPDFSYLGHKGTIALTGYEGVLGYRTDEVYRTREADRLTEYQEQFFAENPDFDEAAWQQEVDDATEVATVMKEEGWEFASHTWGHINPTAKGLDVVEQDTERWLSNVAPIVGDTDIIIFAFGADIGDWEPYDDDNEYYVYLKDKGFDIYCNVDSNTYWVQFNGEVMRMGRRNVDGYRMYYNPEMLEDLFDVSEVWDSARPDSVAEI